MCDIRTRGLLGWSDHLGFQVIIILAWIGRLPVEYLKKIEVSCGYERPQGWTNPVDPMIAREAMRHDVRAEGSGRVDAGAGVVDA